ncbi:hypothetical protein [Bacillus sp. T33-2]|uniref:hypothetical protein n=1 Tax=Bacillus sp. T33-2 TaxID=2054168 RepID=UPI000C766827|nr:hypothetical protein [Bacillus sp. T33-2]PLR89770.1 hypothetical protein CVD19_23480 [Bacillus sp. T33-2]
MRKVYGIQKLIAYLASINYPLTEQQICDLIESKDIPHLRPINNMIVFNLDHIDWWVKEQRLRP